ncbi:MAG TPA: hypothetical protein VGW34_06870, partial [Allosphingosinicella sp.]|nr:hypothetical protein [Allosphingosinicella sp.]
LEDNVEELWLGGAARSGTGNGEGNRLFGTLGDDTLNGLAGADALRGRNGADELHGGGGDDIVYGGIGNDELFGEGDDDRLNGEAGADTIDGGGGNDQLFGREGGDTLTGGAGTDYLYGGIQKDTMTGGTDGDRFLFDDGDTSSQQFAADVITDFHRVQGDLINLRSMDADSSTVADDNFTFIGAGAFSGAAGELRYKVVGADAYLQGDTDGDGLANFHIKVENVATLIAADIVV